MIYDVFLFNGEYDVLDLRLNILGDVVDKFVICEARQTFTNEPKELTFKPDPKWADKIIYYPFNIGEDPLTWEVAVNSPNTNGDIFWSRVFYSMEMMRKPLEVCKDDDIVFISDCDEIWNPNIPIYNDGKVYGLKQIVFYYYLNNRCSEDWTGSVYTTYGRLKTEILNYIKQKGDVKIENGGWHFSYQGGEEQIRKKIRDSQNSFYDIPTEQLMERIKGNKDFFEGLFNRNFTFTVDNEILPDYVLTKKHLLL